MSVPLIDREKLDAMVAEGWLRSQRHPEADLWIYNYTEKTQFEKHWTPETLACRGLILDEFGTVRARPFPKFFNYGTPEVGELPDEPFTGIITGVNARHIWDALRNGQDPTTELDGVPDEIFGWIQDTVGKMRARFRFEQEGALRYYAARPRTPERKEVADYFQRCGGNPAVLFRLLDGKPYDDLIWKAIRPEPTTPDTVWTKDAVAA